MTFVDDIRFYIAEKVAMSDNPLETIKDIKYILKQLEKMYKFREEDLKGMKR